MFIKAKVNYCDVTSKSYDKYVDGVAAVARGASGRWCEVLWFGPEWVAENTPIITSREKAIEKIEAEGDWVDF